MIRNLKLFIPAVILLFSVVSEGQLLQNDTSFTHQDTLRGTLRPERTWWDVLKYDITVQPDFDTKTIKGSNTIHFFDNGGKTMQIDFQEPMQIDSIISEGKSLGYRREGNVFWVSYRDSLKTYKIKPGNRSLTIYFHGKPKEAIRPPWDGGWIWRKDTKGRPWMTVACQGLGASVWYPCKDYQGDEPDDGASLTMIVPDTLMAVGNGRMKSHSNNGGLATYTWEVKNPINNYNIIPYIGKYVNWTDTVMGEKGQLDMNFWVLDYNLEKGKTQFTQAKTMMRCFEFWMGPYPFYEDGYKLIEAPHLGMEHQSAVAYGNGFQNGYRGRDLSGTGLGTKWDFIIVHESGHEWFANNITTKDIADMWVHEGFTSFSETLYTQFLFGEKAGNDYCVGVRKNIQNDKTIIGSYGVNKEGSGDMYYKGENMLQTIRHSINNDEKLRQILRGLNKTYYHQTVTTQQVEQYISKEAGFNFAAIFDQYLRTTQIPVLEYITEKNTVLLRYTNCVDGFNLPLTINDRKYYVTDEWHHYKMEGPALKLFKPDEIVNQYYLQVKASDEHP
ncbi:MAG: family metallopeptidase [Chitinophagaceae bacterium]|nr:family metallopeptidase [Chitinophagaceae bacterium]